MSGDWIKMRSDLYRDPKVCVIADILLEGSSPLSRYVSQIIQRDMSITRNVMRNVTVGALVSVWGVLRHRGKRVNDDLTVHGCTVAIIDDLSDIPGFGAAMESVGWAIQDDESIVLPRFFEEFNVDPAEELKAKNAERQRRFREKHKAESNVTVASQSNDREEKRREEKSKPKSKAESATATRLPADWSMSVEDCEFCKTTRPDLNALETASRFRDYWAGIPGAKGRKLDWPATWRNWVRNESAKPSQARPPKTPAPDDFSSRKYERAMI